MSQVFCVDFHVVEAVLGCFVGVGGIGKRFARNLSFILEKCLHDYING